MNEFDAIFMDTDSILREINTNVMEYDKTTINCVAIMLTKQVRAAMLSRKWTYSPVEIAKLNAACEILGLKIVWNYGDDRWKSIKAFHKKGKNTRRTK